MGNMTSGTEFFVKRKSQLMSPITETLRGYPDSGLVHDLVYSRLRAEPGDFGRWPKLIFDILCFAVNISNDLFLASMGNVCLTVSLEYRELRREEYHCKSPFLVSGRRLVILNRTFLCRCDEPTSDPSASLNNTSCISAIVANLLVEDWEKVNAGKCENRAESSLIGMGGFPKLLPGICRRLAKQMSTAASLLFRLVSIPASDCLVSTLF